MDFTVRGGSPASTPGGIQGGAASRLVVENLINYGRPPYYLFVYAGVRPLVPLEEQSLEDLVWIRQECFQFIGRFPKPIVFGHTPLRQVLMAPDRIGIDTACVHGGKLTCLKFPAREIIQGPGWRR
ncbi:MAG TPA: hypothetical protein VLG48_09670 [Candidatus Methylomirabilis sp.]|nr:hypothetical protein [Candidatus Methylomirabilis sp.]